MLKRRLLNACLVFAISILSFLSLASAQAAQEASIIISPSTASVPRGQILTVKVLVNSPAAVINAAEAVMSFDAEKLKVDSISAQDSIFTLWTISPKFDNQKGEISFGGGIPRPGFQGAKGEVISINFRAQKVGQAQVSFIRGALLAADGKGSNILTSLGSASFKVVPASMPPASGQPGPTGANSALTKQSSSTPSLSQNVVFSPTHPDQQAWYKNNQVEFSWHLPPDAQAVSYVFDQNLSTNPGQAAPKLATGTSFKKIEDGVWYFHLKFKTAAGWSKTYHYRVQIDTSPPMPFQAEVKQPTTDDWPQLFLRAQDGLSGISQYEIKVGSLEDKGYAAAGPTATVKLRNLSPGRHTAIVKAVDKAGNASYSTVHFEIKPLPAPTIDNYTKEIRRADTFFASGQSLPLANLTFYIQDKNGQVLTAKTTADQQGSWHIIYQPQLAYGRYVAWAQAENKNGLPTAESKKISFLVSPSVFVKIGSFVVNYFTVLASLLFVALVIIFIIVLLISFLRRRLRRETIEIETVLRRHFKQLKQEARQDLAQLAQARAQDNFSQEKKKAQTKLLRRIDLAEKKILKEIKDVEDILE